MTGAREAALLMALMATAAPPADLVLVSAKIWTGDPARPEAQALAVQGGRIVAVGTNAEIEKWKGAKTTVVDGKGRRVVPGFIDCHTHMSMGGLDLLALDLRKTKDPAEFTSMVAAYAKKQPAGIWLTDGAWDHEQWTPPTLPTKALLDPATGDHPTCLQRQDGHMMVCNSLALKLARHRQEHAGSAGRRHRARCVGQPDRRPQGRGDDPRLEGPPAARRRPRSSRACSAAVAHAAKNGVTSVQDLPGSPLDLAGLGRAPQRRRADRPRQLPAARSPTGPRPRRRRRR